MPFMRINRYQCKTPKENPNGIIILLNPCLECASKIEGGLGVVSPMRLENGPVRAPFQNEQMKMNLSKPPL